MKVEKVLKISPAQSHTLPSEVEELIKLSPKELETWRNRVLHIMEHTPGYDINALTHFCSLAKLKILNESKSMYLFSKRVFDLVTSIISIVALSPLLLSLALFIKYTTKGPVFFKQLRIGLYGIPFYIYKFRTIKMEYENIYPIPQKAIIPGGLFFRNFKFDELPQLFNVLKGEMSVVGPRPLSMEDSAISAKRHQVRFAAVPGLTGLWQIYTPRAEEVVIKTHLDAKYIDQRSFLLDLKLIAMTIPVLMKKNKNNKHTVKQYVTKYNEDEEDVEKDAA